MPLIPYQKFQLTTSVGPDEVAARLAAAVQPPRRFGKPRTSAPFQGSISGDRFQISRVQTGRNSFVAQISGKIVSLEAGTRIEGSMMVHPMVLAFLAFWLLLGFNLTSGIWLELWRTRTWDLRALIPPGLVLFAWTLCVGAFTVDVHAAREQLASIIGTHAGSNTT